jgi:membrane protein YqaA with SNARE-associated domain
MIRWCEHWANTPHAAVALFLLAFAESSFFPVPPDVLLIALAIAHPKKALRFAAICSVGSVLGGVFGYCLGRFLTGPVVGLVNRLGWQMSFFRAGFWYECYDFLAVFTAGFTPIPYKVFTLSAGVFGIRFGPFLLASALSRSLRFFLVAGLIHVFGPRIRDAIDRHFDRLTFLFALVAVAGILVLSAGGDDSSVRPLEEVAVERASAAGMDTEAMELRTAVVGKRAKVEVVPEAGDRPGFNPCWLFTREDGRWQEVARHE